MSGGPAPYSNDFNSFQMGSEGVGEIAPGMLSPDALNPFASQPLQQLSGLQSGYQQMASEAFNPTYYDPLKNNIEQRQDTSLNNQYAKMGLSGSSANLGAIGDSNRQTELSFYNRQLGDQAKVLAGSQGLEQNMYSDMMGIQGQYDAFQNHKLDAYVNYNNGTAMASAQNAQTGSQMASSGLSLSMLAAMGSY